MKKQLIICEAHQVVDSAHTLSLGELHIIQKTLADIYQVEPVQSDTLYKVSLQDYAKTFNITTSAAYEEIVDAVKLLMTRTITLKANLIDNKANDRTKSIIHWVEEVRYNPVNHEVEVMFSKSVVRLLGNFGAEELYSKYYLANVAKLDKNSIRLYRIANKWLLKGITPVFGIDEFRVLMGFLAGEYSDIRDFRVKVLNKSIARIKKDSNLVIGYDLGSKGRKVINIQLKVMTKEAFARMNSRKDALAELEKDGDS